MRRYDKLRFQQINQPRDNLELINDIQLLWVLYVTWARAALLARLLNAPTQTSAQNRVYKIPSDFYNTLRVYYEDPLTQQFSSLLRNRIVLEGNIINAMMTNDQNSVDTYSQDYGKNADEIAEFLSQFPYWDATRWRTYLYKDISMFFDEIRSLMSGDYEREVSIFEGRLNNAIDMGRYMASGIVRGAGR